VATQLSTLYPRIELWVPGCTQPIILQAMIDVIREFCERTLTWQHAMDAINIRNGVDTYDLDDIPSCARLVSVVYVALDDAELKPTIDYLIPSTGDDPKCQIILVNEPTADDTAALEITVALKPARDATVICDRLYCDWHTVWADGTLAKLMLMPMKRWSNPQLAAYHDRQYEIGVARAIIERTRGRTIGPLQARPKYPWV